MIKIKCVKWLEILELILINFYLKIILIYLFFWDESYTSFEAEEITKDFFSNTKEQNKHIDKFAAKLMLDDFFNENLDEKKNY